MNANIWGRWVARLFKKGHSTRRSQDRPRSLAFETLEDRVTPATIIWTGNGTNNLWSTPNNWDLNRAPAAGDDLVFGAQATDRNTINDLATLPVIGSITISASGYTVAATAPRTLLAGAVNVGSNVGTVSISSDLQLFAPSGTLQQTFTVNAGSTLVVSGQVDGRNDGLEPQQTLTKAGPGIMELTEDNTAYTGAVALANSGGIVVISHHNALGVGGVVPGVAAAGTTTVNANSQLQLKNLTAPVTERLILNGTGVADNGALLNAAGNNTWLGTITLDSDASIGANENTALNITALVTDTGAGHSLTKEGRGRVILSRVGGNNYRGQTIIDDGILTIRDPLSLGAGATFGSPLNGQPQSGTIVNFNSVTGEAGTLQFEFTTLSGADPNAILQNRNLPFDPVTNPVIGFQVYNDLLTLNGPGYNPVNPGSTGLGSLGALSNLSGDNMWSGAVTLGSLPPSTGFVGIGVAADTELTVSGPVGDPNRQPELRKVLPGRLIFNNANTYDGGTRILDGALNIRDSRGLGNGFVRVLSGATLELEVDQGIDGTVLRNHNRNLGFDSVTFAGPGQEVFVPAATGTFTLSFRGATTGSLNANSPTLAADIQTALNGLSTIGGAGGSVTVTKSGNIYRVIFGGTLVNADVPLMVASGTANASVNAIYGLDVANAVRGIDHLLPNPVGGLEGTGFNNTGALRSISGINIYSGDIELGGLTSTSGGSIGSESDARPGHPSANNDYFRWDHSLTVTGTIDDWFPPTLNALDDVVNGFISQLTKAGDGHLILPFQNTYSGKTDVLAGWITVQNNNALGTKMAVMSPTNWQPTTVSDGAAVHLRPLTGAPTRLTVPNNFVLSGTGFDHPFDLLDQAGAIQNVERNNKLTGIIQLNGIAGLGVEQIFPQQPGDEPSQLTIGGYLQDFAGATGGITKLGSRRLNLQGPGSYTGAVEVAEGVALVQHDTALGGNTGTVTVQAGAALELGNSVTDQTGGLANGRGIWGETLILHGSGNALFGDSPLTVLAGNPPVTGPSNNPIVATDNIWRGPISLSGDAVFEVGPNSRLILAGPINDTNDPSPGGSDITLEGGGVLELAGANTYRGTTVINEGVLIVANGQALGATSAGTVVADGASLQLAGSFTVAGEPLTIHGTGAGAVPNVPTQWFQVGPSPTASGQTPAGENVTGRITSTVVDPRDENVIYIGTSGGGAWKTIDGGKTWRPLIDALPEIQTVTVSTAGTFTLSFNGFTTDPINGSSTTLAADIQAALNALPSIGGKGGHVTVTHAGNVFRVTFSGNLIGNDLVQMTASAGVGTATVQQGRNPNFAMFVGSILIDPNNSDTIYIGTGDSNSTTDTFYGTGVYVSNDGGINWRLVTSNSGPANPLNGLAISDMVIDPFTGTLFAAAGDRQLPRNEKQVIDVFLVPGSTFTLSFTHADANGTMVTQTTTPILIDPVDEITRQRIQAALNALSTIGPAAVVTTIGPRVWEVEFTRNLADQNVAQLVANPDYPVIVVFTPQDGGAGNINGATGGPGVWRFKAGNWFNLSAVVSTFRSTVATGAAVPPTNGANPTASADGVSQLVLTPGPDDDYRMQFPTQNAQWTDLSLVYVDTGNAQNFIPIPGAPVLYAALGTTPGDANNLVPSSYVVPPGLPVNSEPINNAVFWSQSMDLANGNAVTWYVGDPGGSPYTEFMPGPSPPTAPDARPQGFPRGQFAQPVNSTIPPGYLPEVPLNGNIKVSAFTLPRVLDELNIINQLDFNDTIVHASVAGPDGRIRAVYRTVTGGQSWTEITPTIFAAPANPLYRTGNFSHSILTLDQNTIFLAGQGLNAQGTATILMSTDAGTTWTDISGGGPHAGVHHMSLDATRRLLVSTDGGLWRREINGSWTNLNGDLAISSINGVATDPTRLTTIVAGSEANGTNVFSNNLTWDRVDGYGGGKVAIDPNDANTIYAVSLLTGTNAVLRKSINGGISWSTVLAIGNPTAPLTVDDVNTARVLVGGYRIMESENGGATWTNLQAPITVQDLAIANAQGAFVLDPNFLQVTDKGTNAYDADTIYVTNGDSIFVTKNHGQSWTDRTSNLAGLGSIVDLEVDPRNRDTIYAVRAAFGGGKVWRSTDAGRTWVNITNDLPNLPTWRIVIDPRNGFLYAGTDEGVFFSTNGGDAWNRFGVGLPMVQVRDLDLNLISNTLVAGTFGRSVFQHFLGAQQTLGTPVDAAVVALSGSSIWTGPVFLAGEAGTNRVTVGAYGTQNLPNTIPSASLNFVGPISDLTPGSNPILAKVGLGDVIFSGANTYGGETRVEEGALVVDNAHALGGNANGTTVVDGAVLELRSNLDAEPVILNGHGLSFDGHYTGSLRNIAGDNTYVGPLTLNTDATIGVDSGSQLTIGTSPQLPGTGTVNGTNDLVKELTGTLVLASNNAGFSGATTVNQGALRVRNAGALGVGAAPTRVLDGAQIQLQSDAGSPLDVNRPLAVSGTGIFGTGAILNVGGDNTWSGNITFDTLPGFSPDTFPVGNVVIAVAGADDSLTISGSIGQTSAIGLTKIGAGELVLTSANTYTGATEIIEGKLDIRHPNALGARSGTAAIQRVVVLSAEKTGSFRITFNGQFTELNWVGGNAPSAAAVQNALNALPTIGGVGGSVIVARTEVQLTTQDGPGAAGTGYVYTVTFGGTLTTTNIPLTASGQNGTGASASFVAAGGIDTRVWNGATLELDSTGSATPAGFTVPGRHLTAVGAGVNGSGALRNGGGDNTWDGPIVLTGNSSIGADADSSLTLAGGLSAAGLVVTKVDPGTIVFPLDPDLNTQLLTVIEEGNVQVDGTIGNVQLSGGTLSGTGAVQAISSTTGGRVNPGDNYPTPATGTLNAASAVLNNTNIIAVNLNGAASPTHDLLQLTGNINLGGASLGGSVANVNIGDSFTIIQTTGTVSGQLAGPATAPVAGGLSATIAFIGDTKFVVDYFTDHVVISRVVADTLVDLTAQPARGVRFRAITFTAQVAAGPPGTGIPTGSVTFIDTRTSKVLGTVPVDSNGIARLQMALGGPLGGHVVQANYSGDPNYDQSTDSTTVTIIANGTRTSTVVPRSSNNPWIAGSPITFRATVRDTGPLPRRNPGGTVEFFDMTTNTLLGYGTLSAVAPGVMRTTLTTALTTVGTHQIRMRYSGNAAFAVSRSFLDQVIVAEPTRTSSTTISEPVGQPDPSPFGQALSFTATVIDTGGGTITPTGTVTFTDTTTNTVLGIVTLSPTTTGQAQATLTTTALAVGNHSITATYNGSLDFAIGIPSPPATQTVVVATSTMNLTSTANPSRFGQTVTFRAQMSSDSGAIPTGQVVFKNAGQVVATAFIDAAGLATFTTNALPVGTHAITAEYAGAPNFTASNTGSLSQEVLQSESRAVVTRSTTQPRVPTTITVRIGAKQPGSAQVAKPTGQVTIFVDNVNRGTFDLVNGVAKLFLPAGLSAGSHKFVIQYSGDGNFLPSTTTVFYTFGSR